MDLEEIEEVYAREIEKADKEFLQALADKKNLADLEVAYNKKIVASREKYYRSIEDILHKQQASLKKKEKKKVKEKESVFTVEPGKFDLTPQQKRKLAWSLFYFKKRFTWRNWIREHTPRFFSYYYYLIKLSLKKFFSKVSDMIHDSISHMSSGLKHYFEMLKEFFGKILKYLSGIPDKAISWFSKKKKDEDGKKKEESKEEKKEDDGKETSE